MLRQVVTVCGVVFGSASLVSQVFAQTTPAAIEAPPYTPEAPSNTPTPSPTPTNAPATPTVPRQTSTTETTPPVAPPPPTSTVARAAQAVAELVRIHGILRPDVVFSSAAVESFSNPNASAVTAAANPVLANLPAESRLSFQAAQSRFGIWIAEKESVRGHLEFDFIDFGKASPTVQALVRLRIASVEWSPIEPLTIAAGQDWDLHAPINPYGVNMVGGNFQAGNTGFMRHQLKALYKLGSSLELAAAIGLQSPNAAAKDGAVELARMPTFALRAVALLGKLGKVGLSGIVSRLRFAPGPDERHAVAGALALFGELTPYETLGVRFEAYVGRNVANLGALGISNGVRAQDVEEVAGFLSARQTFLAQHAVYGGYGIAHALDGDDVVPSYSYGTVLPGVVPPTSSATLAGTGPGIRWNQTLRIGYDYKPVKALAIAVEGFWYKTRHALAALDEVRLDSVRHALGFETAMVYTF